MLYRVPFESRSVMGSASAADAATRMPKTTSPRSVVLRPRIRTSNQVEGDRVPDDRVSDKRSSSASVLHRIDSPAMGARIDAPAPSPTPSARGVLRDVFGYADFRPGQEKLIATVVGGRDAIGLMPTGAGKSLTYQIPARMLPGTVLVVSPLISLMKDQVDALVRAGFRATLINSTLDGADRRDRLARLRRGEYELVYVAPEGLEGGLRGAL